MRNIVAPSAAALDMTGLSCQKRRAMIFTSDNWAGTTAKILAALAECNQGPAPAYGADPLTARVTARMSELFEREVAVFLVPTGTAANALSVAAFAPPWGAVVAHAEGQLGVDECGAPEFYAGTKVIGLPGTDGKLTPDEVQALLDDIPAGFVHQQQPAVLSISNASELGLVYDAAEVAALAEVARGRNMAVHMDGARFANAVVSADASPADLTWRAGVDVLSFGGTKGGCMMAEAIVLFDTSKAEAMGYLRKRAGQLVSKHRFVAAQFDAWLDGGHWLELATHANAMALKLALGIAERAPARVIHMPEANEIFAVLTAPDRERLRAAGAGFYDWPSRHFTDLTLAQGEGVVRLVTSFATEAAEVDRFLTILSEH
jgi:threonine aldolase